MASRAAGLLFAAMVVAGATACTQSTSSPSGESELERRIARSQLLKIPVRSEEVVMAEMRVDARDWTSIQFDIYGRWRRTETSEGAYHFRFLHLHSNRKRLRRLT